MQKAVFLDRDGVLIRSDIVDGKPIAINNSAPSEILPGVEQACRALKSAGFLLVMVTNQPDIGRGLVAQAVVDAANAKLREALDLDMVHVCIHDDSHQCACRKPNPGMLLDAAALLDIDLTASVMVGDRWRDVEAGRRAGCATVCVVWGHAEPMTEPADLTVASLLEAVPWIVNDMGQR